MTGFTFWHPCTTLLLTLSTFLAALLYIHGLFCFRCFLWRRHVCTVLELIQNVQCLRFCVAFFFFGSVWGFFSPHLPGLSGNATAGLNTAPLFVVVLRQRTFSGFLISIINPLFLNGRWEEGRKVDLRCHICCSAAKIQIVRKCRVFKTKCTKL